MQDNPYILKTWDEIAKLTPYCARTIRDRYGEELKAMGIVRMKRQYFKNRQGKTYVKRFVWAPKELIEHYFLDKAQRSEL